jgi:hypothetical protein
MKSRMYDNTDTWNPFKGCSFDCIYCRPSFQAQAKRQMQNCMECYHYVPHTHPERLDAKKMPNAETVFVCGNGDISFCSKEYTESIIERVARYPQKTFYFQSKQPGYFSPFITQFPSNVILVTTLETNRNEGYKAISKAPIPSKRCEQFRRLDYPRKVVTIEPVMDFDTEIFFSWILNIKPEYVWLGLNSHPEQVQLREPSKEKVMEFIGRLGAEGIEVRGKDLRGITG